MKRVLIVAAHPDDEILGVGGTAARHVAAGDEVHVVIIAEGAAARYSEVTDATADEVEALKNAARGAAKIIGSSSPSFLNFPDNRLDTVVFLDLVRAIEKEIAEKTPTIVYTHHMGDLNVDHELVARATLTACRPLEESSVAAIYGFETVSNTEWHSPGVLVFDPNHFVEITPFMKQKLEALRCYEREMRAFPHPRSYEAIEALATWRGASVGMRAAEAFTIVRQLSRI